MYLIKNRINTIFMDDFKRSKIRKAARASILGNSLSLYAASLIVEIILGISFFFRNITILLVIILILTSVFEFGLAAFYLEYVETNRINYKSLFVTYRTNSIRRFLLHFTTYLIKYIIIIVFASLLLIPGLIKKYSYSQVKYVRASYPDLGVIKCLLMSKKMMKWHRFELFLLDLTFLPLYLLAPFTGGLLLLYLTPYYSATMALYHQHVRSRYALNKDITRSFLYNFVANLRRLN